MALSLLPKVGRPRKDLQQPRCRIEMTQHPTVAAVQLKDLPSEYRVTLFHDALTRFVAGWKYPTLSQAEIERVSARIFLHFQTIPVFHKIKLWLDDPHGLLLPGMETRDAIHVRPARKGKYGADLPGRFDTALVRVSEAGMEATTSSSINRLSPFL